MYVTRLTLILLIGSTFLSLCEAQCPSIKETSTLDLNQVTIGKLAYLHWSRNLLNRDVLDRWVYSLTKYPVFIIHTIWVI